MIFDTLIYDGLILTMNPSMEIIQNGFICIQDGIICRIEPRTYEIPLPAAIRKINAKGMIVAPGLINTHTHLPMSLFRGIATDMSSSQLHQNYIVPAENKYIHPENVRLGTLLSCCEMLLSGTTTCCDGYFYEDDIAWSIIDAGMRGVLGQCIIDSPAPDVPDPENNIRHAIAFIERWQSISPLIKPSIFCQSAYSCSSETLKDAKDISASKNLLFQIHVAETKEEWNQIRLDHRKTPIQYLDSLEILDQNTLLVHGVWVNENDIDIISKCKAKISHNPESNAKLASGIAPVPEFFQSGITVGLGTDNCASNNNMDLFQEMSFAAKLHKVNQGNPSIMDAQTILKMATINAAKAIQMDQRIGSLEPGKEADLIILDINSPHCVPMHDPMAHMVYSACQSDVKYVFIAGKQIVKDRQILTINMDEVIHRVRKIQFKS